MIKPKKPEGTVRLTVDDILLELCIDLGATGVISLSGAAVPKARATLNMPTERKTRVEIPLKNRSRYERFERFFSKL